MDKKVDIKVRSAAKAAGVKKTLPLKQDTRRPVEAKPENYFILITGVPLKNLRELANSLETMNDWVFSHHVNDARNDFSNWMKEILKEDVLSEEIRHIKN